MGRPAGAVTVVPTLAFMAGVYRLSLEGGPTSPRFRAYVQAAAERSPVHGYNPGTSKPVLETVESLLAAGAEELLASVAAGVVPAWVAGHGPVGAPVPMHITVATPGMWTDRLATEVGHRLQGQDPGAALLWFDEPTDAATLRPVLTAEVVRALDLARSGPPASLAEAVAREGEALARAGRSGVADPVAAEALEVYGSDPSLSVMVAFLYGDDAARTLGFTPLGLGDEVGYRHAVALATARISD